MYRRAVDAGRGTRLTMQETTVFRHPRIATHVRM
jgi:hypothetical protein